MDGMLRRSMHAGASFGLTSGDQAVVATMRLPGKATWPVDSDSGVAGSR